MTHRLGIDLRLLGTTTGARGGGEVAKRVTQGLLDEAPLDIEIVFVLPDDPAAEQLVGLFSIPSPRSVRTLRISRLQPGDVDLVLCFAHLPKPPTNVPVVLVVHDLIILKFWDRFADYVMHAMLPSRMYSLVRPFLQFRIVRSALRALYRKYLHSRIDHAQLLITDSENSRRDIIALAGVRPKQVRSIYLGVSQQPAKTLDGGTQPHVPDCPYLLFVGVPEPKRELAELVDSFDKLRSAGHDLELVFAGKGFSDLNSITDPKLVERIRNSPNRDSIRLLGYIADETRNALYAHATAFVYPSIYEGFGLPVLEAMVFRCPVVYYNNSSMREINEGFGFPVSDATGVIAAVEQIIALPRPELEARLDAAQTHAAEYTWDRTVQEYIKMLEIELSKTS